SGRTRGALDPSLRTSQSRRGEILDGSVRRGLLSQRADLLHRVAARRGGPPAHRPRLARRVLLRRPRRVVGGRYRNSASRRSDRLCPLTPPLTSWWSTIRPSSARPSPPFCSTGRTSPRALPPIRSSPWRK